MWSFFIVWCGPWEEVEVEGGWFEFLHFARNTKPTVWLKTPVQERRTVIILGGAPRELSTGDLGVFAMKNEKPHFFFSPPSCFFPYYPSSPSSTTTFKHGAFLKGLDGLEKVRSICGTFFRNSFSWFFPVVGEGGFSPFWSWNFGPLGKGMYDSGLPLLWENPQLRFVLYPTFPARLLFHAVPENRPRKGRVIGSRLA